MTVPERFPKVESPYHRGENDQGDYVIEGSPYGPDNYVKQKFSWVFDRAAEVEAIEKLDGTNVAVEVGDDGSVLDTATRMGDKSMQPVDVYNSTNHSYIVRGVQNAVQRGYVDDLDSGWHFGELVGPKMQGNPHELDEHLFVPFEWLRDKCEYRSYGKYSTEFDSIRDWFRGEENGLFSLFATRMHGQDLDASRPQNGTFIEGIIFVHPDFDGQIHPDDLTVGNAGQSVKELAKLRRDMYDPFQRDEWPMTEHGH